MTSHRPPILDTELDGSAQAVAAAGSPAEVFKVIQLAASRAAPRSSVFLVRKSRLRGWGSSGYEAPVADAQRTLDTPFEPAWLERLGPSGRCRGSLVGFGQPPSAEALTMAVRLRGQPIALLQIERAETGDDPWQPAALGILVTVAQLRLELDLVQRKLAAAPRREAPDAPRPAPARVAAAPAPAAAESTAVVEVAAAHGPAVGEAPELQAARRYARLVATDIRLYNEEAVQLGRRNGDLARRLGEQLGRGKETFLRRHGKLGPTGLELLHEAYVQVLAGGDAELIPGGALD